MIPALRGDSLGVEETDSSSCTRSTDIEHLLCARHMLGAGGPGIVVGAVKGINLQMSVEL